MFPKKSLVIAALLGVAGVAGLMLARAQETATSTTVSIIPQSPANLRSIESYSETQLTQLINALAATPLIWPSNYVANDTPEGAVAEYMAHNPEGPAPAVLQVQYDPGLNYQVSLPTAPSTTGPLPLAADTITAPSVRASGTFNTIIRNGTATPVRP